VVMEVEVIDENHLIAAWSGKTYEFRARLNALGVPLAETIRILPVERRDMSDPDNVAYLLSICEQGAFRQHVCNLRVLGPVVTETAVGAVMQTLESKAYVVKDAF
jgi:hypothetical protein